MKEVYAEDLQGVNVRIVTDHAHTHRLQFVQSDTGEVIENIVHAHIDLQYGGSIWCTVTLLHNSDGQLFYEGHTFNDPDVDMEAMVGSGHDTYTSGHRRVLAAKNALVAWRAAYQGKSVAHPAMQKLNEIIDML